MTATTYDYIYSIFDDFTYFLPGNWTVVATKSANSYGYYYSV